MEAEIDTLVDDYFEYSYWWVNEGNKDFEGQNAPLREAYEKLEAEGASDDKINQVMSSLMQNHPVKEHPKEWASDRVRDLISDGCDYLWPLIKRLVEKCPDDEVLNYFAAGPVEEFLSIYGNEYLSEIEELAKSDKKFRKILSGVWQGQMDGDLWARITHISQAT